MSVSIHHGDIVYCESADALSVTEGGYLVAENGFVAGIYPVLPEQYAGAPVTEHGRGVLIPAFSDLHIHASQFVQRGIGMDKLLFDWLNDYTFPQESRFADMDYAGAVYDAMADELLRCGTFHAALFTTVHYDATDHLFRALEERGIHAYVGKVNQDMNSAGTLQETTEDSLRQTERFLAEHPAGKTVRPILVPRFAPTCSDALLSGLGKLAAKYGVGVHTHLVESRAEAQFALDTHPGCSCDAEIYQKHGLLDHGPAIFAHVIFPTPRDAEIIRSVNAMTVHCPESTTNITAGIMPVKAMRERGFRVSLGTDVGGCQSARVFSQAARAVQISKLREFYAPEESGRLTFANAFYLATAAGGALFDRVGSLAPGYRFNALVIDGLEDAFAPLSPAERLERFCYAGDDRNIVKRYLNGTEINI